MKKLKHLLRFTPYGPTGLAVFLILLISTVIQAQELTKTLTGSPVKGVVKDNNGKPLPNATVTVKGRRISTTTATDGSFTIAAKPGETLVISYVGFRNNEIKAMAGDALNI